MLCFEGFRAVGATGAFQMNATRIVDARGS